MSFVCVNFCVFGNRPILLLRNLANHPSDYPVRRNQHKIFYLFECRRSNIGPRVFFFSIIVPPYVSMSLRPLWRWKQHVPQKPCQLPTRLHGIMTHSIEIKAWIFEIILGTHMLMCHVHCEDGGSIPFEYLLTTHDNICCRNPEDRKSKHKGLITSKHSLYGYT
jgi:hypothetical protein